MRLDRDRGRAPAVGRLQRDAHEGRGHAGQRRMGHVRDRDRVLCGARRGAGARFAGDVATLARRGRRRVRGFLRTRRGPVAGGRAMTEADAVAGVLWTGVTAYAEFGGADFGVGFWSLLSGGG